MQRYGEEMIGSATDREIRTCCATFYQNELARLLLGDVFHPGGLALTGHMREAMTIRPGARSLARVGHLGLADMTVSGPLPEEIKSILAWVACVAGAGTVEDYVAALQAAGFHGFADEDQREALLEMVGKVLSAMRLSQPIKHNRLGQARLLSA